MSNNIATLASFSDNLDTLGKLLRVLEKEGVAWEQLTCPINNRTARRNLATYLKYGCPKITVGSSSEVVVEEVSAPIAVETDLVHDLFLPPEAQIKCWQEWNTEFELGIGEDEFSRLSESVPAWPKNRLTAVVATYHFDTPQREFEFYWPLIARAQEANWKWDQLHFDPDHLRWLKGYENVLGLRWEVIDVGANCNRKLCDVRLPKTSPGAAGLATAALFPDWVRAMNGSTVPYIWLPGYEVTFPGADPWQFVLDVSFRRGDRQVRLFAYWFGNPVGSWSVPVLLGR